MNNDSKYIARRMVVFGLLFLVLATGLMFNVIKAEVYNVLYPPPPEPVSAQRLEKETGYCWDVLEIKHDEDLDSLVLTLMETCSVPQRDFARLYDVLQDMLSEHYLGETFVLTEWVHEEDGVYIVKMVSLCEAATFIIDPATSRCSNYFVENEVPASRVRRWWLND